MIRFFTAFILLSAFVAQTFDQTLVLLDFYVHPSSFARACENKAVPKMHCNGKCQMMKKLKAAEKQEQQNPTGRSENRTELFCPLLISFDLPGNNIETSIIKTSPVSPALPSDKGQSIFHPPA